MIISAMIFAGLTLLIGGALGFFIGQARARMIYEEKLRDSESARARLESQLAGTRDSLRVPGGPPAQPPDKERK
jgi:hypothetical protein